MTLQWLNAIRKPCLCLVIKIVLFCSKFFPSISKEHITSIHLTDIHIKAMWHWMCRIRFKTLFVQSCGHIELTYTNCTQIFVVHQSGIGKSNIMPLTRTIEMNNLSFGRFNSIFLFNEFRNFCRIRLWHCTHRTDE